MIMREFRIFPCFNCTKICVYCNTYKMSVRNEFNRKDSDFELSTIDEQSGRTNPTTIPRMGENNSVSTSKNPVPASPLNFGQQRVSNFTKNTITRSSTPSPRSGSFAAIQQPQTQPQQPQTQPQPQDPSTSTGSITSCTTTYLNETNPPSVPTAAPRSVSPRSSGGKKKNKRNKRTNKKKRAKRKSAKKYNK